MLACLLALLSLFPAEAAETTTLRVLTQNVYGRKEHDCEKRYKALAAAVLAADPPYDVVAFQEHWRVPIDPWYTCDADVLSRAMEQDGRYKGAFKSIRHLPRASSRFQVSGGVSIFTLHQIVDSREKRFSNSRDLPLSGYALARVKLPGDRELDVWDTHLEAGSDGCDDACRRQQAGELGRAVTAANSGNPVLILGDFNTGGPMNSAEKPPFAGNGGYSQIVAEDLKGARDLWLEGGKDSGFTYDCLEDKVQSCEYRERIDYVFLPEDRSMLDPKSSYILVPRSVSVAKFKTKKGDPVSDHFGLEASFELSPRPAPSGVGAGIAAAVSAAAETNWDGRSQ